MPAGAAKGELPRPKDSAVDDDVEGMVELIPTTVGMTTEPTTMRSRVTGCTFVEQDTESTV